MGNQDVTALLPSPNQQQGQNQNKPVPVKSSSVSKMASPYFLIVIGFVILLLGLSTSMFDIEATEAAVGGTTITNFVPNWRMLVQIPEILGIGGVTLSSNVAAAYYAGWIVEFASLVLIVCFDLALEAIWHAPSWAIEAFRYGMYFIALVDVVTNFVYEPGIPAWYIRLVVAVLIALSSFFFPIIGVLLMEKGFKSR